MKKFSVILASFLIGLMVASAAYADGAIPYTPDVYNGVFFTNNEVFKNNDGGIPSRVDVGDQFWGILRNQNIDADTTSTGIAGTPLWSEDLSGGSSPSEISAYFAMEVKNILYNPVDDVVAFFFGPTTDPNGIVNLANNDEIMRIYSDDDYTWLPTNRATGVAGVTDGTAQWSLGFNYDLPAAVGGGGTQTGYFYIAFEGNNRDLTGGSNIVGTYGGFEFLGSMGPAGGVTPICDPNENFFNPACVGNIAVDTGLLVDIWFNAEIALVGTPDGVGDLNAAKKWDIFSQDPAVFFPNRIPEPATMLLLGTGLVGLAGASRRRRKAATK